MKKTFAFLSMLLVAVTGFLFGCSSDKYANLKIQLSSPNLSGEVLTLYYGQSTDLAATVSGIKGINKSVYFSCSDPDALEFSKINNNEDGTSVVVKALKPTYSNLFTLTARSVEDNTRYAQVNVKVILPIQGMDFNNNKGQMKNLAVSSTIPLKLAEQITFYPQQPYVTNQKAVAYSIVNYGVNNPNDIAIDQNGILTVAPTVVDNLTTDASCLTVKVTSLDNESISTEVKINVIRDIDVSTVSYDGAQVSLNGAFEDKTNIVLFSNSSDYYSELLSITVQTGQELEITPIITGDNNVVEANHVLGEDSYTSINGVVNTRTQKFKIRAKSIRGVSYVNFKIKIKNIANDMEYLLTDDAKLTVEVSGLPKAIDLKQDGTSYNSLSTLIIYDSYQTTQTTMMYGSKILVNVSSESNSAVDEQNQYVKVEVLDGDRDVSSYFTFSDANGLDITPVDGSFNILSNNAFYVKATDASIGKTFTIKFTTVINKFIEYANGSASGVQTQLVSSEYYLQSNYGVNSIETDKREYVLKLFTGTTAANSNKTKLTLTFNENADTSNVVTEYNSEYINVEKIDTNTYLLTGIKIGELNLTFVANNGFSKTVRVKVVQEITGVDIKVDSPINSQVITQSENNIDGKLFKVSAKAGGRFNVYSVVYPHVSGIISYDYTSSEEAIATINTSGMVVTRSAGEVIIEVTTTYYRFEVDASGYLTVVEDTFVNNFILTIFIPTASVSLNQTVVNVYSAESLGFDYKDQSFIEIYALISPVTATIYNNPDHISYTLIGDNGNLVEIATGRYQAFLNNGQTRATVKVVVTVNEFGTATPLVCTVNIIKAKQIKNISVDNLEKSNGIYILNMRQDETHSLAVSFDPTDAYITELKLVLIDYDTGEMYTDNSAVKLVTLDTTDGYKIISSPGGYPDPIDNAGQIYLRIYAKDSMTAAFAGTVYVDIYINVTDGSVNNPYVVSNVNELIRIGDAPTKHYVLGNDIDLSGVNFRPMTTFSGTLNGYYYVKGIDGAEDISRFSTISNLSLEANGVRNIGLFQEIAATGAVFNIHLTVSRLYVSDIEDIANIGSLVGINNGFIMNCSVEIKDFIVESYDDILTGDNEFVNVGGMVGQNKGHIFNFATTLGIEAGGSPLGLTTAELKDDGADYFADATFRDIINAYGTGGILNDDANLAALGMTVNDFIRLSMPYTNYVDGMMVIRDSRYQYINAGGIVGNNMNTVCGIYGIYNRIDESSFQVGAEQEVIFTATVQNQGIDSSVKITPNGSTLKNKSTTIGGVIGYMSTNPTTSDIPSLYNVSSSGDLEGLNNVGGIVGKIEGTISRKAIVSTTHSSGRINASELVGGAFGSVIQANIAFARVENYQNLDAAGSNILIQARNKVGGVIGSAQAVNISYIYAVTYVGTANNYDIKVNNNDLEGYVGGLVGYAITSNITDSYSKLKLNVNVTVSSSIGGLVGYLASASSIRDCYFMGALRVEPNPGATTFSGTIVGAVAAGMNDACIDYVYTTVTGNYVGNQTAWYIGSTTVVSNRTAASNFAETRNWKEDVDNVNNKYPVLKYTVTTIDDAFEALFIKLIPTSMRVVVSTSIDPSIDAVRLENDNLLIKYSANNEDYNIYNITDLYSVSVTPESIKQVSLIVTSSNPNVIKITNNGQIITAGIGNATLTFTSRINTSLQVVKTVYVVQKITSMQIFTNANLAGDGLLYGDDGFGNPVINEVAVRKNGTQNLYPTFYCDDQIVYPTVDVNYTISDETYLEINNDIIAGKLETASQSVIVTVSQQLPGLVSPVIYFGAASDLKFNVSVYSGATGITLSPNNKTQITKYVPQQVAFTLETDSSVDYVTVNLIDSQGYVYKPNLVTIEGGDRVVDGILIYDRYGNQLMPEAGGIQNEQELIDTLLANLMISISNSYFVMDITNSYTATVAIEIKDNFAYNIESSTYYLQVVAGSNENIAGTIEIEIVPQELLHMDASYHLFENVNSTTNGFVFEEKPSNAIIPGRFGILKINTAPVYAGIEDFYLHTDGSEGYVNYSQLVLDTVNSILVEGEGRKEVYIFAPTLYVQDENPDNYRLIRLSNYFGTEVVVLSEYEVTPSIKYEGDYILIKTDEVFEDSQYFITYQKYNFDGNLYLQMVSSSGLYVVDKFDVHLYAEYVDGRTYRYSHEFVVNDLPSIEITTSRDYISVVNAGQANCDTITVSASLTDGLTGDITLTQFGYRSMAEPQSSSEYLDIAQLSSDGVLYLKKVTDGDDNIITDETAQIGDTIVIVATYTINVDGKIETITAKKKIRVVDVVLEDVEIDKVNSDNLLSFTVSSTIELKAKIVGYGDSVEINNKSIEISRQLTDTGAQKISYWKYVRSNGNTVNIDDASLTLPFTINKTFVGSNSAIISLVGSTQAGAVLMQLSFYYYYTPADLSGNGGMLMFTDNPNLVAGNVSYFTKQFTVQVNADSNADRPIPIYTLSDLYGMSENGNYILMSDITIERHTPIKTTIASLDGNNKIITIKNFEYDDNSSGSVSNAINLGLFDTVEKNTIIKNVIVAYYNNQQTPLNLVNYATINFGGIAAVNNGIITNCDVLSVYPQMVVNESGASVDSKTLTADKKYPYIKYTFNIQSSVQIDGTIVESNIGAFVGKNGADGKITNSRVGRESVTIITPRDNNGTTYGESVYEYTAPVTLMRVAGSGNIGGFVGSNTGIISSCYFKNGQIEITTYGSNYTQVGGFAAVNTGAIYGSYAAGWEEELYLNSAYNYLLSQQQVNAEGTTVTITSNDVNASRRMGGGLFSNANIAGFVYNNGGVISNSYAALNLNGNPMFAANRHNITSSVQLTEFGNLNAGGFVFINAENARIETSYSVSKLKSNITTHGAFVGVSPISGDVQNQGVVDKCYFLLEAKENIYDDYDPAYSISQSLELEDSEIDINTNEFIEKGSFAGFSFDNENYAEKMVSGAIWAMKVSNTGSGEGEGGTTSNGYPELISANNIAISLRVLRVDDTNPNLYSYIYVQDFEKGSVNNPQIITSATEYNNLFSDILSSSTTIENVNVKYTGNIRLVTNIDFTGVTATSSSFEYSSLINSKSIFDGNNMYMYNILLSDESASNTAFGLFKSLNSVGVKNLSLTISKVSSTNGIAVGALAGVIVDSDINNINIVAAAEGAAVSGKNFVGGLAGIILSSDEKNLHYANNIQSNVAVLASYTSETSTNIVKSGELWNYIIPPAKIEGSTSSDNNLRLQYLPNNVSYAGGIAGVIDLLQAFDSDGTADDSNARKSIAKVNVRSANVGTLQLFTSLEKGIVLDNEVNIEAEFAGGVFGFIGEQTYFKEGSFVVYESSVNHYINSTVAAGGISAINYGFIEQVYVSHAEERQKELDGYLQSLVTGTANIARGNETLYTGKPTYLGGITGINIGSRYTNSGAIKNCYNRVDLRNSEATRIGGIVGATHIGSLTNVYTTATIMGNLTKEDTYFGQIIGQLLDNTNNNFYVETVVVSAGDSSYELELSNVVAVNAWNGADFEALVEYTEVYGRSYTNVDGENVKVKIGAIYAPYHDSTNTVKYNAYEGYVKDFGKSGAGTFFFDKIYKGYNKNSDRDYISLYTGCENLTGESNNKLYYYTEQNPSNLISQDVYKDLMTVQAGVVSDAKQSIFSTTVWSDRVWLFDDTRALLSLRFGYIPNISSIYTAEEFLSIINEDPASSRTYVIMNDLDFNKEGTNLTGQLINIGSNFRGTIIGNTIKDEDGKNPRKPILFNLVIESNGKSDTSLFTSVTNAHFQDFNIVVSDYIENYSVDEETGRAVNTRSSIFLGNATNTVVGNVHIYDNIKMIQHSHYLKTRIKDSDEDLFYVDNDTSDDDNVNKNFIYVGKGGSQKSVVMDGKDIVTNANYFGGIVANANNVTISDSSFNINVKSKYSADILPADANVFFGGISGRHLGTITNSKVTGSIEIAESGSALANTSNLYAGGVVGYLAGTLTNITFGKPGSNTETLFRVGYDSDNTVIDAATNKQDMFIGGVVGSAQALLSSDSDQVSELKSLSVYNIKMELYIKSKATVGGVIGINEMPADGLSYKNKNADVHAYDKENPDQAVGDIFVYAIKKCEVNLGGLIGKNTYTQLNNLVSNANIHFEDEDAVKATCKYNIGGIIGTTYGVTITNAIQEAHSIKVYSQYGVFNGIGGVIGAVETSASGSSEVGINYAFVTPDLIVTEDDNSIIAGGVIGNASANVLTVANTVVYSTVTIKSKKTASNMNARAVTYGGIAGSIKNYRPSDATNGAVAAVTVYYPDVANIELSSGKLVEHKIGQLFGVVSDTGVKYDGLYYNEAIFAMYTNQYFATAVVNSNTVNVSQSALDTVTDPISGDPIYGLVDRVNLIMQYPTELNLIKNYMSSVLELTVSQSAFTSYYYSRARHYVGTASGQFTQVDGTKLNPTEVVGSGFSYQRHNYYRLTGDYTVASAVVLPEGAFLIADGFAIKNTNFRAPAFENISQYAVVSGMLIQGANISGVNNAGILAKTNNGLIIACGVSGSITGDSVAGLVGVNNGVVMDCFSIATVTASTGKQAAGLVFQNAGGIISCHATGLVTTDSTGKASGFVGNNTGIVTSCYTVANIFGGEGQEDNIYPFAITNSGTQKYNYYDINAYVGSHKESKTSTAVASIQTSSLSSIYELNDSGVLAKTISINGNWYENNYPINVIANSTLAAQYTQSMTNTWFNYGYGVVNLDYTVTSPAGKARLLLMLYTGNGKPLDGNKTNGFDNSPYQVTNAGILEAFVLSDHIEQVKSWYIVMNDFSFAAYDNWSDTWDENGVFFRGDFNGNGKKLKDMNSKNGLFRVFADQANAYNFTLTHAFSQTGLLAAQMQSDSGDVATLENIIVKTDKLDGATYNVSGDSADKFNQSPDKGTSAHDFYFSGGLVGYMLGGTIKNCDIEGSSFSVTNTQGYVGGFVGYYTGGKIILKDKTNAFKNITTVTVTGNYAGAYIGYANSFGANNDASTTGIGINTNVTVTGEDSTAGFIAVAKDCKLVSIETKAVLAATGDTIGGLVAKAEKTTITTCKVITTGAISAASYAGGVVGIATSGSTLTNTTVSATGTISADIAGGIVASLSNSTIEYNNATATSPVASDNVAGQTYAGGIVGTMDKSTIKGTTSNKLTNTESVTCNADANGDAAAGIVAHIASSTTNTSSIEYVINQGSVSLNTGSYSAIDSTTTYQGGIVGRIQQQTTINQASNSGTFANTTTVASDKTSGAVIGGIAGEARVDIAFANVSNSSNINLSADHMGGIIGKFVYSGSGESIKVASNTGSITNTTNITTADADVSTKASTAGGIVGHVTSAKISESTNSGAISGYVAGGFVGYAYAGEIKASTNSGTVTAVHNAGGIGGEMDSVTLNTITNAAAATVTATVKNAGGIAGKANAMTYTSTIVNKANVVGVETAGGIAGESIDIKQYTTLTNEATSISATNNAGGVFGTFATGTLSTSASVSSKNASMITITASGASGSAGGVIGFVKSGTFNNAFDLSAMTVNGLNAGGYFGQVSPNAEVKIETITLNVAVTLGDSATPMSKGGGIIGYLNKNGKTVTVKGLTSGNKTFTATTTSSHAYIGGLIGYSTGEILFENFTSTANPMTVTASNAAYVGGAIGYMDSSSELKNPTIKSTNTMSLGTLSASEHAIGGAVGYLKNATITTPKIEAKTITATATDRTNVYVGGVVGCMESSTVQFVHSSAPTSAQVLPTITVDGTVGGVAGYMKGLSKVESTNKNTKIAGTFTGHYTGAVVGESAGDSGTAITNIQIETTATTGFNAGGIVGRVSSNLSLSKCILASNTSRKVTSSDTSGAAGGMVGYANSPTSLSIDDCDTKIAIGSDTVETAGGIIGTVNAGTISITNCEVNMEITSTTYAGGIVGYLTSPTAATITSNKVSASKNIYASADTSYAGGILGYLAGDASISDNTVESRTIKAKYAGGIYGEYSGNVTANVQTAINNGSYKTVTLEPTHAGGMVFGKLSGSTASITITVSRDAMTFVDFSLNSEKYFGSFAGDASGVSSIKLVNFDTNNKSTNVKAINSSADFATFAGYASGSLSSIETSDCIIKSIKCLRIGSIVGRTAADMSSCTAASNISGEVNDAGGVAAYASSVTISSCTNSGTISMTNKDTGTMRVGGVIGYADGTTITDCSNSGSVTADSLSTTSKNVYGGGIVGCVNGASLTSCTNSASVKTYIEMGSITGQGNGDISRPDTNCGLYNNSLEASEGQSCAGGIVGKAEGETSLSSCKNTGKPYGYYNINDENIIIYHYVKTEEHLNWRGPVPWDYQFQVWTTSACTTSGLVGYDTGHFSMSGCTTANTDYCDYTISGGAGGYGYSAWDDDWQLWNIGYNDGIYNNCFKTCINSYKGKWVSGASAA